MPEVEERRGSGAALRCFLDVFLIPDAAHDIRTTLRPRYERRNERIELLDVSKCALQAYFQGDTAGPRILRDVP